VLLLYIVYGECIGEARARRRRGEKETLEVILAGTKGKTRRKGTRRRKNQNLSGMYNEENFDFSSSFHYHQHTKFISMSSALVLTTQLNTFSLSYTLLARFSSRLWLPLSISSRFHRLSGRSETFIIIVGKGKSMSKIRKWCL